MAHGGYGRKKTGRPPLTRGSSSGRGRGKGPGGVRKDNEKKKSKIVSIKNQIRSIERLMKKDLPAQVKEAQQKRLEELKQQSDLHATAELERKMALRYRKVKFFERRKIERRIRRTEKQQRALLDHPSEDSTQQLANLAEQLHQLKEDLEYVRFFPKTEKYISLNMGKDDEELVKKRIELRERIKANLLAAAAAGLDLEETGSEDEAMDMSEDDFFIAGSSSDDADADDEWTDKSPRVGEEKDETSKELVLPVTKLPSIPLPVSTDTGVQRRPGKAPKFKPTTPGVKDQRQKSAKVLMPPPRPKGRVPSSTYNVNGGNKTRNSRPTSTPEPNKRARYNQSTSSNSDELGRPRSRPSSSTTSYENMKSSVSDGPAQQTKPKRKRRPKKKKT